MGLKSDTKQRYCPFNDSDEKLLYIPTPAAGFRLLSWVTWFLPCLPFAAFFYFSLPLSDLPRAKPDHFILPLNNSSRASHCLMENTWSDPCQPIFSHLLYKYSTARTGRCPENRFISWYPVTPKVLALSTLFKMVSSLAHYKQLNGSGLGVQKRGE